MCNYEPLSREEVIKAIEHKGPERVPMMIHHWLYENIIKAKGNALRQLAEKYPNDILALAPTLPGYMNSPLEKHPDYVWISEKPEQTLSKSKDGSVFINDYDKLDKYLSEFPDPAIPEIMDKAKAVLAQDKTQRYRLGHCWFFFFERFWSFRGMENALMDFYLYPDEVKKLFRALCDFYKVIIRRCKYELGCDGFIQTDDLGTQESTMFSPEIFREFFKPFYKEIIDECHRLGMHFWLHSCGNITRFMDDLVELKVDVLHPIQKYAMDEVEIAGKYSGKICFWAGLDMQNILPFRTPEDVRKEARFLIDTFDKPEGGMMLTAGNGITVDVPVENLEAFFEEAYKYGKMHRDLVREK